MKVAIVHDWLVTDGGAEKVLKSLCELYPTADVFTLVDFLSKEDKKEILQGASIFSSFIQNLPFTKKYFRYYLPLFIRAIESFDLNRYTLIISSSWAVAKGVRTNATQLHVSYCHTPIRYAWDLYDEYTASLSQPKKMIVQWVLKSMKQWDYDSSDRVDYFIANSTFVQERIRVNYKRDSVVIHPPVDTKLFTCKKEKEEYYVSACRLVAYKKVSMIVKAFNENGKKLVVIGDGEEYDYIKSIAKSNIKVLGWIERTEVLKYMQNAKAFVYAAEEDFGIVPVEAMACGTPVIAYGVGGVRDTVIENKTGLFFEKQTVESLNEAIHVFATKQFDAALISVHAQKFSKDIFENNFKNFIAQSVSNQKDSSHSILV